MRQLDGMTPQRRGRLFNELVGDLLKVWGVERAQVNVSITMRTPACTSSGVSIKL